VSRCATREVSRLFFASILNRVFTVAFRVDKDGLDGFWQGVRRRARGVLQDAVVSRDNVSGRRYGEPAAEFRRACHDSRPWPSRVLSVLFGFWAVANSNVA
jgi:hypothetical protein